MYGQRDDPDARIRRAWVTVHARDAAGAGLGAGVVVADGYLVTCAHVVNAALGRPKLTAAEPTAQDMLRVAVSFPVLGDDRHAVQLAGWLAPRLEGHQWWTGDLAVLKVGLRAPDIRPVAIREPAGSLVTTWYADGAQRSLVDVRVQAGMGPWYILDPGYAPLGIQPGHSGAPLWDRERGCAVGLVVSAEPHNGRSYAIKASVLLGLLTAIGVLPAVTAEAPDPRTRARLGELVRALYKLGRGELEQCAERLRIALDLPVTPRTCEELVGSVLDPPRGMATLLRVLSENEEVAGLVRKAAAKLGTQRLLTQDEFDELRMLLSPADYPEVRAAAQQAVPHILLCESGPPDVGVLLEDLEDRVVPPDIVPPVIQVVEEVAAARPQERDSLRDWSDRVTRSLGLSPEAVRQCRWSAESRASARTVLPVLRVWLWANEPTAETLAFDIRLYDAHGQQVKGWLGEDDGHSRAGLCAALSDAVERLDSYAETAGVEFLLQKGFFGMAVDRLPTTINGSGPRPVGWDRPVVLRGQTSERAGARRRRWEQRRSAGVGPYLLHDLEAANGTLTQQEEIACVVACCPPDRYDDTLSLCRYLGVPVVLWQRSAHGPDTVDALRAVVPQNWPESLREQVRRRRVDAMHDTAHMGAHLSLLWEDPNWTPPEPRLAHPTTGEGGVA